MQLVVFKDFEAFKNYSRTIAAQRHGYMDRDSWSIEAHSDGTLTDWPRVAIEKYDNPNHTVELHFLDPMDVINVANVLQGKPEIHLLNEDERLVVHMLALGDKTYRAQGEAILMKYSRERFQQGRKSVEMDFLSEVFSKSPDLMLRNAYRKEILDTIPPGVSFDAEDSHFLAPDASWMPKVFEDHWRERGSEFPQVKWA